MANNSTRTKITLEQMNAQGIGYNSNYFRFNDGDKFTLATAKDFFITQEAENDTIKHLVNIKLNGTDIEIKLSSLRRRPINTSNEELADLFSPEQLALSDNRMVAQTIVPFLGKTISVKMVTANGPSWKADENGTMRVEKDENGKRISVPTEFPVFTIEK